MSEDYSKKKRNSPNTKSPGFWFFTGDWLKDPELRFCSIFARGLLVDLLCFMFEAKDRGYLIWPDGSPRSNDDIADAVSGGDRAEKVKAIEELERKGVLSRDERGVLFSRRMARLGEISQQRSVAGSTPKTKQEQTPNKPGTNDEQKPGVTDTDTDTDTDTEKDLSLSLADDDPNELIGEDVIVPAYLRALFIQWLDWQWRDSGKKPPASVQQIWASELHSRGEEKAIADLRFSISKRAKNLLDSKVDYSKITKQRIEGVNKPGRESNADREKRLLEELKNGSVPGLRPWDEAGVEKARKLIEDIRNGRE